MKPLRHLRASWRAPARSRLRTAAPTAEGRGSSPRLPSPARTRWLALTGFCRGASSAARAGSRSSWSRCAQDGTTGALQSPLAALQDRQPTLFYRLLTITSTSACRSSTTEVRRACQEYSHIIRRHAACDLTGRTSTHARGPRTRPTTMFALIVARTRSNPRPRRQGGAGWPSQIGKAGAVQWRRRRASTRASPCCSPMDVGQPTTSCSLSDPLYGSAAPIRAFVAMVTTDWLEQRLRRGCGEVWPGCVVQWEDFSSPTTPHPGALSCSNPPSTTTYRATAAVVVAAFLPQSGTAGSPSAISVSSSWLRGLRESDRATDPPCDGARRGERFCRGAAGCGLVDSRGWSDGRSISMPTRLRLP